MTNHAQLDDLPRAGEALVRAHASEIRELADQHGISALRVSSTGDLVGHVPEAFDAIDIAEFEIEAGQILGAELFLITDRVLGKPGVSQQYLDAAPL